MDDFSAALDFVLPALERMRAENDRLPSASLAALHALSQATPPRPIATAMPEKPAATLPAMSPVGAASALSKAARIAPLRDRVTICVKCPHLAATRTQTVFGVGNLDAELMFIGEAPGADEDRQGEPFVGASGELLTKIISAMGFTRDDVFIANILKCRPDMPAGASGNRPPTPSEMETCLPYLGEQIEIIAPRVLVALGSTAVRGLLGPGEPIGKLRGRWQSYRGTPLMVTYHPSYLLRNQSLPEKRKVWEDMLQVLEKLGHPISNRQRNYFTER